MRARRTLALRTRRSPSRSRCSARKAATTVARVNPTPPTQLPYLGLTPLTVACGAASCQETLKTGESEHDTYRDFEYRGLTVHEASVVHVKCSVAAQPELSRDNPTSVCRVTLTLTSLTLT